MAGAVSDPEINAKVQFPQGKDAIVVKSGGQIAFETGAKLYVGGADVTSAVATGGVAGAAAGYVMARGEAALDGSNPTPIPTGLTTVVAFVAMLKGSVAPGVGTSVLTGVISGATVLETDQQFRPDIGRIDRDRQFLLGGDRDVKNGEE